MTTPDYSFDGVGFSAAIGYGMNDHQIDDFALVDLAVWNPTSNMNLQRALHPATRTGNQASAEVYGAVP